MKKLKEFIKKKQLDNKFKKLGDGYQLGTTTTDGEQPQRQTSSMSPTHPADFSHQCRSSKEAEIRQQQRDNIRPDLIASAAEKRFQQSEGKKDPYAGLSPMQKMVKLQAKKALEEEQKLEQQMRVLDTRDERDNNAEKEERFVPNVLYTCEIFDNDLALPKTEMMGAIESALYDHMPENPLATSVWLIYTFNSEETRKAAIEIICKYLQNIIDHPNESKYLRIKKSNRIFMEKIASTKGALEFLNAVGFCEELNEDDACEQYFVMPSPPNTGKLAEARKALIDGRAILIRVFRNPRVFAINPSKGLPNPPIPHDFFRRTADDIRQEQKQKSQALEQMTTLRTQRMRDLDAKKKELVNNPYKYCYIRVRFPNIYLLQGIFNVYEKFVAIREFVAQHLLIEHGVFTLSIAAGTLANQQLNEEQNTLLDYGLVPSALIHFDWEADTLDYFSRQRLPISYLKTELVENAEQLD